MNSLDQLVDVVRLGQVVVRPEPQPGDPLHVAPLRRGDQDRDIGSLPDGTDQRLALEAREHEVHDEEVGRGLIDGLERPPTVGRLGHLVPGALEVEPEQLAEASLVLDDEDAGTRSTLRHGRIVAMAREERVKNAVREAGPAGNRAVSCA